MENKTKRKKKAEGDGGRGEGKTGYIYILTNVFFLSWYHGQFSINVTDIVVIVLRRRLRGQ